MLITTENNSLNSELKKLVRDAKKIFNKKYSSADISCISAFPASVILLGDHTHYNDGIFLLTTVNVYSVAVCSARNDEQINIAVESPDFYVSENSNFMDETSIKCGNLYLGNLISVLKKNGVLKSGFNLLLYSNIPQSIGMGFVASNQLSFVEAISYLFELNLNQESLRELCTEAEKSYLGKMSNPTHYFAILNSETNSIIKVDLRFKTFATYKNILKDYKILLFDNGTEIPNPRKICNERIEECTIGVQALRLYIWGIKNLRDVSIEFLASHLHVIPNLIYKRILYTVKEKIRAENAIEYIENNYFAGLGKLLYESHRGLRADYDIGNSRHDFIVDELSKENGVIGAKLISCSNIESVICIAQKKNVSKIADSIFEKYYNHYASQFNKYIFDSFGISANLKV
jgi:galactokinase